MNSDIRKFQLSNYHLVIVIICVFGFLLRIIGAINIAITPEEARILLSGLGGIDGIEAELSYLQQILIEMINGVFGKHLFMMRLPTILVGSLVILMPGFLKQEFDRKASIWLSAFLAIDPFLIANSIVINGSIFAIFFAWIWIIGLYREKPLMKIFSLVAILASGRGGGYFFSILILTNIFQMFARKYSFEDFIDKIKDNIQISISVVLEKINLLLMCILILVLIPTQLSSFVSGISNYLLGWKGTYQSGNLPTVYLIGLMSYLPLIFLSAVVFSAKKTLSFFIRKNTLGMIIGISLVIVMFFPGHLLIDLVWISVLLWILLTMAIRDSEIEWSRKEIIFMILIGIAFVSIFLSILRFANIWKTTAINQENILFLIFVCVFFVIGIALVSFFFPKMSVKSSLKKSFIFIIFIIQLVILSRTIGINQQPEQELFWNGYSVDIDLIESLVLDKSTHQVGSMNKSKLSYVGGSDPTFIWKFVENGYEAKKGGTDFGENKWILTKAELTNADEGYLQQKLMINAYPKWARHPFESILNFEYWSWFLWRQADLYGEYNYLNFYIGFQKDRILKE
jgi:hypothetical protein